MNKQSFSLNKRFSTSYNQKGQSLLEIAVSLGLVALIITILTITTLNGLRNSQFAKNQVLASSYAQQGVELIKVMRQKDCVIKLSGTTQTYKWFDDNGEPLLIWTSTDAAFSPTEGNNNYFIPNTSNTTCELVQNNLGESLEDGLFIRRTKLEIVSTGVLRVTVIVNWTDFSGEHEAKNVSLVTNYENI